MIKQMVKLALILSNWMNKWKSSKTEFNKHAS